jgi:hypothetical protein
MAEGVDTPWSCYCRRSKTKLLYYCGDTRLMADGDKT